MPAYIVNKDFIIETIDEKITIFDPQNSYLYTLNEMSTVIFKLLQKGKTTKEIRDIIIKNYDVDPTKATKDLDAIIERFFKSNILTNIKE